MVKSVVQMHMTLLAVGFAVVCLHLPTSLARRSQLTFVRLPPFRTVMHMQTSEVIPSSHLESIGHITFEGEAFRYDTGRLGLNEVTGEHTSMLEYITTKPNELRPFDKGNLCFGIQHVNHTLAFCSSVIVGTECSTQCDCEMRISDPEGIKGSPTVRSTYTCNHYLAPCNQLPELHCGK